MSSSVGPKLSSRVSSGLRGSSTGRALMTTPCALSSVSSPGSANAGCTVEKSWTVFAAVPASGG